jgi:GAF domain-containing protein
VTESTHREVKTALDETRLLILGAQAVPMLKENELIGALIVARREVRPFTDKQIAVVTNLAAQAVIAIENARLLKELRERTEQVEAQSQELVTLNRQLEHRAGGRDRAHGQAATFPSTTGGRSDRRFGDGEAARKPSA